MINKGLSKKIMFRLRQVDKRAKSKQRFTVYQAEERGCVKFLKQERARYFLGIKIV